MSVPPISHRIAVPVAMLAALAFLVALAFAAPANAAPPLNLTPPTATSDHAVADCDGYPACVGDTVFGDRGTWTDEGSLTFHYEWLDCGNEVECDLLSSFDGPEDFSQPVTVTPAMAHRGLKFRVYATGPDGTTVATSEVEGPFGPGPEPKPFAQVPPSIDLQDAPQPLSGQTLIGRVGTWNDDYRTFHYFATWLRCEADGTNCRTLEQGVMSGPNEPITHQMVPADVGYVIRLQMTVGSATDVTVVLSAPTAVVQNGGPPVNLAAPLLLVGSYKTPATPVSAPVGVGDTLTATAGRWTVNDNLIVNWLRCARDGTACVSIPGADSAPGQPARQSYIVAVADSGSSIRADVTASAFLGTATVRTPSARVGPDPAGTSGGGGTTTKDRATVRVRSAKVTGSGKTLAVYLSLGAPGKVKLTAKGGGTTLGKVSRDLGKGKVAISVKLSDRARKLLQGGKKVKTTLALTLRTDAGDQGSLKQSVTLRGASR